MRKIDSLERWSDAPSPERYTLRSLFGEDRRKGAPIGKERTGSERPEKKDVPGPGAYHSQHKVMRFRYSFSKAPLMWKRSS